MENRDRPQITPLPGVLKTLKEGCNLTAEKPFLMVIPLLLDLFLLFGPKLRISNYFESWFNAVLIQVQTGAASLPSLESTVDLLSYALVSVNLFGLLQTFPVGVGVLFGTSTALSPLGQVKEIQLTSLLQILPLTGLMLSCGVILGTLYYSLTAKTAAKETEKLTLSVYGMQLLNTILLYIAMIIVLVILWIPVSCILSFALMTVPVLYQIILFVVLLLACWLIIPLFYTPHGIFMKHLDFPHALKESARMSLWSGSVTVRFMLFSVLISAGMDMIWAIPNQSSWLILISIFGHAYVSTALLASSFILFRDLGQWGEDNRQFIEWRKNNPRFKKLIIKEPEQK